MNSEVPLCQSSDFLKAFAPQGVHVLQRWGVWDRLFPDNHAVTTTSPCISLPVPLPAVRVPPRLAESALTAGLQLQPAGGGQQWYVLGLRWPLLLPLSLAGLAVGAAGAASLHHASAQLRRTSATASHQQACVLKLWAASFAWFATMNATAVFTHNFFVPTAGDQMVRAYDVPFLYLLGRASDVGATAAACFYGIAATAIARRAQRCGECQQLNQHAGGVLRAWPGARLLAASLLGNLLRVSAWEPMLHVRMVWRAVGVSR
jgi:hypothetical protein